MGLLSAHEAIVWARFQKGESTSEIAEGSGEEKWTPSYVSRVLNRAKGKIRKALKDHATSHRLDIESIQEYKGLLKGLDYQANAGIIVWYKHDSYAGKLCPDCPKESECRETLDTIMNEYNITLRPDEEQLYMTQQSVAIFNKLAAKEVPRYKRKESE
ncbi:MAG: hypothetical protein ACXACD_04105 [Candidatus Thorarchaeota archaeon]|jgi:hypothetical protein